MVWPYPEAGTCPRYMYVEHAHRLTSICVPESRRVRANPSQNRRFSLSGVHTCKSQNDVQFGPRQMFSIGDVSRHKTSVLSRSYDGHAFSSIRSSYTAVQPKVGTGR